MLQRISLAALCVLLIVNTFFCRYCYAFAGRAIDWQGVGMLPMFFVMGNFSVAPGVLGTLIAQGRAYRYWLWWIPTMIVGLVTLAVWGVPCTDPSILLPSPGPVSMPSLFPMLLGALIVGSWLTFFAVAFIDLARRAVKRVNQRE